MVRVLNYSVLLIVGMVLSQLPAIDHLKPEIAALTMSGSSLLVAVNALLLKRLWLPAPPDSADNVPVTYHASKESPPPITPSPHHEQRTGETATPDR